MEMGITLVTCCICHVSFWITSAHNKKLEVTKKIFFCPNGHQQEYVGKPDAKLLEEKKHELKTQIEKTAELEEALKKCKKRKRKKG